MKKIRFYSFLLLKLLRRYSWYVLTVILILGAGILFIANIKDVILKPNISEGLVGTYTQDNLPDSVTNLVSQGLTRIDGSGKATANLVTGWQINSDATEYTLTLKKNLYWSDGSKIKAADINISLTDASVFTPDDNTIDIKLADSYSFLPELLNKPILKKGSLIGTGPYTVNRVVKDRTNDTFIDQVLLSTENPKLPNLTVNFYSSEEIAKSALKLGKVQSIIGVNKTDDFKNQAPFALISKPNYSRLVTIFYNNSDPILSDKNFRLALSFAAPKIKSQTVATTSFPPTSWVFNPNVLDYLDNPDDSKTYLAKVKTGLDKVITLTTTTTLSDVGQQVVSAWQSRGIKSELRVESGIPQNFQALLIAQDIPLDPDQYSLWHSTQTETNISQYNSKRADKDLEDGRKITQDDLKKQKYQDFQKVLIDDSPATFLYFPEFNVIFQKKIDRSLNSVLRLQYPNIF